MEKQLLGSLGPWPPAEDSACLKAMPPETCPATSATSSVLEHGSHDDVSSASEILSEEEGSVPADDSTPAGQLRRRHVAHARESPSSAEGAVEGQGEGGGLAAGAGEAGRGGGGEAKRGGRSLGSVPSASAPAHCKPRESPLSSDAIFSQSHAGLFNLCIVVLVAVNFRLILENLMKYGILMRSGFWFASHSLRDWPLLMCGLSLSVFPLTALFIEKLKARCDISEKLVASLHALNIAVEFLYPAFVINRVQSAPLGGFILIFNAVVIMMKLVSYAHTNMAVRNAMHHHGHEPTAPVSDAPLLHYPDNITIRNMLYFMAAPTLCYQLGYPRSSHIRKGWLLQQTLKLITFTGLALFIVEQYINPIIQNSQHPFEGHLLTSVERVLKLSIPTLYVWLCLFYCFFHLWLNILGEMLRFGDREFYRDWWNAKTIEEYWKLWNMPVHRWMVRHIYFPCLSFGLKKPIALFIVFFLSAVFHEVLIGIPCHMLRLWAFLGMIFQVPLVLLTNFLFKKFQSPMVGNMLFWFFFCIVGQPICVLLYYHDVQLSMRQQGRS